LQKKKYFYKAILYFLASSSLGSFTGFSAKTEFPPFLTLLAFYLAKNLSSTLETSTFDKSTATLVG